MKIKSFFFTIVFFIISFITLSQPYSKRWEAVDKKPVPQWFADAKFGIFIHWGLYSVPAFSPVGPDGYSEWYWMNLTNPTRPNFAATIQFHKKVYGDSFQYTDFAPLFKAEFYDPKAWASLIKKSGAKYIVPTSKHHDGFCLWPSAEASKAYGRPWNAVEVGPKRDVLGELAVAARNEGLIFGIYYSLYEWYNPLWLSNKNQYVIEHMHQQFKDVVTRYQPSLIFSDGEWDMNDSAWHSAELLIWLFYESSVKDNVVVDDRWGKNTRGKHGSYYTSEYGAGMQPGVLWEESRGMGMSYGYNRTEKLSDYKTARELLIILCDIVSRGGNLLLDIGSAADGTIPVIMEERLLQMGEWLQRNGEAIYGTKYYTKPCQWSEGLIPKSDTKNYMSDYDINKLIQPSSERANIQAFFTQKGAALYCIIPITDVTSFILRDLNLGAGSVVKIIGNEKPLNWKQNGKNVIVELPANCSTKVLYELAVLKIIRAA